MTASLLTALLVVLVGARVRLGPPARLPRSEPGRPVVRSRQRSSRQRSIADPGDVAAWCARLAQATRSGSTLTAALRDTDPPHGGERTIDTIILRLDRGAPLAVAIGHDAPTGARAKPTAADPLDLALTVLQACAEQGGPPAEPLDRAAAALRDRAADRAERDVHSAQARISATVMTALPITMLTVLVLTSASVRGAATSPSGVVVIVCGLLLNLAGRSWMSRVIRTGAR